MRQKIFGSPGYCTALSLSRQELAVFRDAIGRQWLTTIAERYPQHASVFRRCGISQYHQFSHLVDHSQLWPKESRVLPTQEVDRILGLPFIGELKKEFGSFSISNVVYGDTVVKGRQEIYWRLVRPAQERDVGSFHADQWFHQAVGAGYGMFSPNVYTIKVWIPIYCERGKNGLIVVPDSHMRDYRYRLVENSGKKTPVLCENIDSETVLLETEPGTLVVFNEKLLHGGAVNRGGATRVSAELTLVFAQQS